ncbi:MAG: ubiquinone biosynthesis accessory factor UbiJ [Pontibacterium sp.]
MFTSVALETAENSLNFVLKTQPHLMAGLAELDGRVIQVNVDKLPSLYLVPHTQGVDLYQHLTSEPDLMVSGSVPAFINMAKQTGGVQSGVQFAGDVALAAQLKALAESGGIDWEAVISQVFGDLLGHEIATVGRKAVDKATSLSASLMANLNEFVSEELRAVPSAEEAKPFFDDIDALRDRVERLAAKVAQRSSTPK